MSGLGRILIVGSTGQVGRELQRSFSGMGELVCWNRQSVDLEDEEQLRKMLRSVEPELILNAAAYTAVDRAESEPELAATLNERVPRILAEEAKRRDSLLVHYSTDYVFDGTKQGPWSETDLPHPLNVYGATKLAGEEAIKDVGGKYLIFRTSWVYGPHGNNFLLTMLRLGRERDQLRIVGDQTGAPTTSIAIADATRTIVEQVIAGKAGEVAAWAGVYHMTCAGQTSWCDFARQIFLDGRELIGNRHPQVEAIRSEEYPTAATRPRNSVLSNEKLLHTFKVQLPGWEAALAEVIHILQTKGIAVNGAQGAS